MYLHCYDSLRLFKARRALLRSYCFVQTEHETKICALWKDLIELGVRGGIKAVALANAASKNTARINAAITI